METIDTDLELTDPQTEAFTEFARASLKVAQFLIDAVPERGHAVVDAAIRGGGRLHIEFGPLPAFDSLSLVLVEREGRRHVLTSLAVTMCPPS